MTPDHINFQITDKISIGIGRDGRVMLLVGDNWHYIQNTNFGKFLLEAQGWYSAQPVEHWPKTGSAIQ